MINIEYLTVVFNFKKIRSVGAALAKEIPSEIEK